MDIKPIMRISRSSTLVLVAIVMISSCLVGEDSKMIVSFEYPESLNDWYSVNDGVMGGRSKGSFTSTSSGGLLFFGDLSLENNGGFASIRSRMEPLNLSDAKGLLVRARGDGRTYTMNLWGPRMGTATSYRASMPTNGGEIEEIFIPFSEFRLTSYGRLIRGQPLNTADIRSIGFTISDKNEGPFKLEILSIQAVLSGES
ncbi:MAG: CIA30 family protein [Puniceicoccaceae bacterium]